LVGGGTLPGGRASNLPARRARSRPGEP